MNHVFVDFENVPTVDLVLIAGQPVQVTLLIGAKQRRLELDLVRQIHAHADKVTLVEVGASGRNALDLVLAWHLGRTAGHHESDQFFVVSRDKDFDPLIAHLRTRGLKVGRVEAFAALPFLPGAKKPAPAKATMPVRTSPRGRSVAAVEAVPVDERLEKLARRLKNNLGPRPKNKSRLLAYINTGFGGKLTEAEQNEKLAELTRREVLFIDARNRVTYDAG